ncbi:Hypothetical protein, putative [Bodo saltans]|uniref:C2 domain-containing protein n=1 Tax=Bodo saltans TaxID=75058 RepID=A0A0S4JFI9_BODSA|nr:Hypothetical protein, putative [Bodo saltans]|eukprot:CUG88198.1 Hypothetical protein, putative [Bodo saltans]
MGKLSIGVVSTEVYRTNLHPGPFHVFVRLRVDGKYIFTTKKRNDRRATFLETFVVGNTHRLALVEASVYHRSEHGEELLLGSCVVSIKRLSRGVEKVREHVLVGVSRSPLDDGGTASAREKMIGDTLMLSTIAGDADSLSFGAWASTSVASLCATTPWGASETNKRSAFNGSPKTAGLQSRVSPAWNIGGDGNGTAVPHLHIDRNDDLVVTGKIVLSLFSDDLGDYGLSLNTKVEEAYTQRLRRLCFLYHRAVLDRVDLLIADVRENYEVPGGGGGGSGAASPSVISSSGSTSSAALSQTQKPTSVGSPTTTTGGRGNVTIRIPEASHPDTQHLPYFGRTFADVLERVTTELGPEKQPLMLTVTVEGANNLAIDVNAYPNFSQMNPFVVIRSDWEQLETTELLATSNPVYNPDTCTFHLEVLDPSTFRLDASVMTRVSSRGSDEVPIGHSAMTLQCLPIGLAFSRVLPLVKETNMVGILRLSLTAQHFGRSPEMVDEVSHRLRQLTRFLIRYEPAALPFVDAAVQKHELVWDAFMGGLIQKYGREPGTVQLGLCVNSFCSLVPPPPPPLSLDDTISVGGGGAVNHRHHHGGHNKRGGATRIGGGGQQWPISAYVSIRMGDTHLRTAAKKYYGFEEVIVNDTFVMDVARETDELHIEVVEEGTESVIGRVDLTILGIQRGVTHTRSYTIVANAGTKDAACSGRLSFSMHCDQIGVEYEVDHESECMFAMRLTRFCERYIPEKLHRVDIAVATTEDMETFLGQLAFDHGPEPSYVRVSVTVEGLKHIGQRYLNSYTHVILECGVLERHETRIAKMGTQDPEFHETWVMDQPRRDLTLRLKLVASQASNMSERVLIATAAIPIIMDTTSEVRWVPLSYVFPDDVTSYKGTIGVGTFVQPLALSSMGGTEGNRSIIGMSIKGGGSLLHARHHLQQQQQQQLLQLSGGEAVEATEDDHHLFMSPLRPFFFLEVHSVRDLPPFRPSAPVGSESDAKHSRKKQDMSKKASGGASSTSTVAADSTARVYFVARIIHVSASDVNNNYNQSSGGGGDVREGPVVDISNVDEDDIIFESSRVPFGDVDANACVWNTDSPSSSCCSETTSEGGPAASSVVWGSESSD